MEHTGRDHHSNTEHTDTHAGRHGTQTNPAEHTNQAPQQNEMTTQTGVLVTD